MPPMAYAAIQWRRLSHLTRHRRAVSNAEPTQNSPKPRIPIRNKRRAHTGPLPSMTQLVHRLRKLCKRTELRRSSHFDSSSVENTAIIRDEETTFAGTPGPPDDGYYRRAKERFLTSTSARTSSAAKRCSASKVTPRDNAALGTALHDDFVHIGVAGNDGAEALQCLLEGARVAE